MKHRILFLLVLVASFTGQVAFLSATEWHPIFEDTFDREMIGPGWHVLRGDWRIEDGKLRVTRIWPSDNNILCTRTMPRGDMRAVIVLRLDNVNYSSIRIGLRIGEQGWGGGGYPDFFQARLHVSPDKKPLSLEENGVINIAFEKTYTVEMTILDNKGTITIDGKTVVKDCALPIERSEVNRQFYMNCMPNGWVHAVKLYSRRGAVFALPLATNSRKENKQATVYARDFIDPGNPAPGMQAAINSLPATGGAVVLPAGEFVMRRHLALRSGVSLRGQGCDKTFLKHADIHETKIVKLDQGVSDCRVTVEDASRFLTGDGISFGGGWSHVGGSDENQPGRNHYITAIEGSVLTVRGIAPKNAKSLKSFFPLVFCVVAEFVQVQDMTLRGPDSGEASGGFNTCPISFGSLYGPRIQRINVENFPADGISVQLAAEALVTDNTVTGTGYGFHPGTQTQRFLWGRNHSVGNDLGLYFCFSNENGVYYKNTLDNFGGYPGVGDVFNLLVGNDCKKGMGIGGAYAGLFFNNRMASLGLGGRPADPGLPLYFGASHYYVVAEHQLGKLSIGESNKGLAVVGNTGLSPSKPLVVEGKPEDSVYHEKGLGLAAKLGLKPGAGRDKPVARPSLPEPIVDGRKHYGLFNVAGGFQKALDQLAETGGTLQLPGGRYPLKKALELPSKVTLAGHGVGTVLYAANGYKGTLITGEGIEKSAVRSLTILGRYDPKAERAPAIDLRASGAIHIENIDIRGWEGDGIHASGATVTVRDSRVIGTAGDGYRLSGGKVHAKFSLAKSCRNGFVLENVKESGKVEGCVARSNRSSGLTLKDVANPLLIANNSGYNNGDGILLENVTGGHVVSNLCRTNNQALEGRAGIRLAGTASGCTVAYNHCSDDEIHASQAQGIIEEETAGRNVIRFNLACPMFMNHQPGNRPAPPALIAEGKGSIIKDNQDRSVMPSGSSIESIALGFDEHPHKISMRKAGLKGQEKQARNGLNSLTKLLEDTKKRAASFASQAAELRKKQDPANAKKLQGLEAQQRRFEGEVAKYVPKLELAKARHSIAANRLKKIEQERNIRIARYTLMEARWDSAPAARIKKAEEGVKKAEDDLEGIHAAIARAEKIVADLGTK